MNAGPPVDLVCFDLGGVLVRICRSWQEACHAARLDVRRESLGRAAERARRELMDLFGTGKIDELEWAERLSVAIAHVYSPAEVRRIHYAWSKTEYEGALDLVNELHAARVATACLSNTNHAHWRRLIHHDDGGALLDGLPEYPSVYALRHHFASHVLGVAKPDPGIYRALEDATGRAPGQILFFDDLPTNVGAAKRLGWHATRINPHAETVPQLRFHLKRHGVL